MMFPHLLAVAPMIDYTNRHFRYFMRLLTRRTLLYTEMITTQAILRGYPAKLLDYHPIEHPLALQLGGSDPKSLAECARMAEQWGYDEVNLNVGCPSDRVQQGRFGACLMKEPKLVACCVREMQRAVRVPVTVKTRLGVDELDHYEALKMFIQQLVEAGCQTVILHARKAWLKGLSPKENRSVPPLNYERVYQIKNEFPQLNIVLNGGVQHLEQVHQHLKKVDGVMIGRQAYTNPYLFAEVDHFIYGQEDWVPPSREAIVEQFSDYVKSQVAQGEQEYAVRRHLLGLFHGVSGAKQWRREVSVKNNACH